MPLRVSTEGKAPSGREGGAQGPPKPCPVAPLCFPNCRGPRSCQARDGASQEPGARHCGVPVGEPVGNGLCPEVRRACSRPSPGRHALPRAAVTAASGSAWRSTAVVAQTWRQQSGVGGGAPGALCFLVFPAFQGPSSSLPASVSLPALPPLGPSPQASLRRPPAPASLQGGPRGRVRPLGSHPG